MQNGLDNATQEKRKQNAKQRVQNAFAAISKALPHLVAKENYQNFLEYMAKMRHFDFNTVVMLYLQPVILNGKTIKERAETIHGYNTWPTKQRQVQKGSTSLMILVPYKTKGFEETIESESIEKPFALYTTGTVFDIAQTEATGEDMVQSITPIVFEYPILIDILKEIAAGKSIQILESTKNKDERLVFMNSYHSAKQKRIVLRKELTDEEKIETLLFEIACLFIQDIVEDEGLDETVSYMANSVVYMMKKRMIKQQVDQFIWKDFITQTNNQTEILKYLQAIFFVFNELYESIYLEYKKREKENNNYYLLEEGILEDKISGIYLNYAEIYLLLSCLPPLKTVVLDDLGNKIYDEFGRTITKSVNPLYLKFPSRVTLLNQIKKIEENTYDSVLKQSAKRLFEKLLDVDEGVIEIIQKDYTNNAIQATQEYLIIHTAIR